MSETVRIVLGVILVVGAVIFLVAWGVSEKRRVPPETPRSLTTEELFPGVADHLDRTTLDKH
jgi:hypothetical protein